MLTDIQKELRKSRVGASEVASILGLSPFRSAYDVWLEKTGQVESQGNRATRWGDRLEEIVLDIAEDRLGQLARQVWHPLESAPIASTLDGLVLANNRPVEAKTSGIEGPIYGEWGEEGTDEVPDYYYVQVQTQLLCTGADLAYLAAILGGRGFSMYEIKPDPDIHTVITECATVFMEQVKSGSPPSGSLPSADSIKRRKREPNKTISLPADVVSGWLETKEKAKIANAEAEQAAAVLQVALGDAEAGVAPGIGTITYFEQTRKAYEVKETSFRVLRLKKEKP